jgi:hypothetical protein
MWAFKLVVSLAGISALLLADVSASTSASTVQMNLAFVDCPANSGKLSSLRVRIIDLQTRKSVADWHGKPTQSVLKAASFALKPGPVELMTASSNCSQSSLIMVPDQSQVAVSMFASKTVKLVDSAGSLGGSLPFAGVSVSLVYKKIAGSASGPASPDGYYEIPAVVDGRSYYAGQAPSGEATVRLYDGSHARWLDVATVYLDPRSKPAAFATRDISERDVENGMSGGT